MPICLDWPFVPGFSDSRAARCIAEASGNLGELSTYAPALGPVVWKLGRHDEGEALAQRGRELGDPAEAEGLAREALEFSLRTDCLAYQGHAHSDLAEVLEAAGRRDEAAAEFREALDCYERKEV